MKLDTEAPAAAGNPVAEQPAAARLRQQQPTAATDDTSAEITEGASGGVQGTLSTEQLASGSAGDLQQLADSSGLLEGHNMNLMPAITNLIAHISHHLSTPDGNPQLALTFQPLVNMALHMQLQIQASMPDASAMSYLSSLMAAASGAAPAAMAAAEAAQVQSFDPQVLIAHATAAAAAAAAQLAEEAAAAEAPHMAAQLPTEVAAAEQEALQQAQQQPPQQQRQQEQQQEQQRAATPAGRGGSRPAGRRRQQSAGGAGSKTTDGRRPDRQVKQRPGSARPQRQRKKSKLLQEFYDDEGLEPAASEAG